MSLLSGVNTTTEAEAETDRLGGFRLLDSGVHLMKIETAYLHVSTSGAKAVKFSFKNDTGSLRADTYFASGNAKGNKTYYEKDGKQYNLPGFTTVNDIFVAAGIDGGIDGAVVEDKVIKLYSKDAAGEVPTKVSMIVNLLDKEVALGVQKIIVDKTALGGDNAYHPTGETRETNEINKVFTTTGLTIPELNAGTTEPSFLIDWKDKNDGVVLNKSTSSSKNAATGGAPKSSVKKMFK